MFVARFRRFLWSFTVVVGLLVICGSATAADSLVYVHPQVKVVSENTQFRISVMIDSFIRYLHAFQVDIVFDSSVVESDWANILPGSIYPGSLDTWLLGDIYNGDSIVASLAIVGAGTYVNGPGEILSLWFESKTGSRVYTPVEFAYSVLLDTLSPMGEPIDHTAYPGTVWVGVSAQVEVWGVSLTSTIPVSPGSQNVPMLKLCLTSDTCGVDWAATWTAVKVDNRCQPYTSYAADIDSVKLFYDKDGDGVFDPATDSLMGQGEVIGADGGSGIITIGEQSINTDTSTFFIVYNIATDADASHYCGVRLCDSSYITILSPDKVSIDSFPIQTGGQPLPVELLWFTATPDCERCLILVCWETASETNSYKWIVERSLSSDGGFVAITEIRAQGNTPVSTLYEFRDCDVKLNTTYFYRLVELDCNGTASMYGPVSAILKRGFPYKAELCDVSPNPFCGRSRIGFFLPRVCSVRVSVWNLLGMKVKTLIDESRGRGHHFVYFNGRDDGGTMLQSGVYFCMLEIDKKVIQIKKMIVIKERSER